MPRAQPRLPKGVVRELMRDAPALERRLSELPNVDRRKQGPGYTDNNPRLLGGRVRSYKVQGHKVVIKRVHIKAGKPMTARQILRNVNAAVDTFNNTEKWRERMRKDGFRLVKPAAYAISDNLAAMPHLHHRTIAELAELLAQKTIELNQRKEKDPSAQPTPAYIELYTIVRIGEDIFSACPVATNLNDVFYLGYDGRRQKMYTLTADE